MRSIGKGTSQEPKANQLSLFVSRLWVWSPVIYLVFRSWSGQNETQFEVDDDSKQK